MKSQKHLGIHIKEKVGKANRGIGIIKSYKVNYLELQC